MTSPQTDVRARRPQDHAVLIEVMQLEAGFPTYRDVLLFAAAVGWNQDRRVPLNGTGGEGIRIDVLTNPLYSDSLISMIAVNAVSDDPEILDAARLEERIRIFEEYANGGLEYIQEQINTRHQTAALVVLEVVTTALAQEGGIKPMSVDELLGGVKW
ncbi:DNA phosphorothioation-associated protein 4 [Arthrobacter sp. CAU 1506]|uniref:DNA phosphorothioation-associated protein 4 n=1 Tax=Arthrobacter sp. CAU 1506 TaxID=2560052 RepID=UPI0010AC6457|nr:DNA phosphorothioation-associated protein 4 [Arthrobacter sp. CAU 1506]TJY69478.1 DNA phosphorothioation-associated protein 4 [Arthrobacter sp. CAU 1506]